jgi:hypothetical protein
MALRQQIEQLLLHDVSWLPQLSTIGPVEAAK